MRALLFAIALGCSTPLPPSEVAASVAPSSPNIATLAIPGDPAFVDAARDVIGIRTALSPSLAADAGLLDDAVLVPSYSPEAVRFHVEHLDADIAALRSLPWDDLTVDQQIDVRWLFAQAETTRHSLLVERRWEHRPSEWIEPLGYTLVAFATVAPDRPELMLGVAERIPGMVDEMRTEVTAPTTRDVTTAVALIDGVVGVLGSLPTGAEREGAIASLRAYEAELNALSDLPEYRVIGADAYAWRLEHTLLLPWTPDELLAVAQAELDRVDALRATLDAPPAAAPTPDEKAEAEAFSRDTLLALYDDAVEDNLASLRRMGVVTVPDDLPAIRARETPKAVIPLSGDGGSMNPPPLFGPASVGHWNVQNHRDDWTIDERLGMVTNARRQHETWFGYYAVHEGVPGHHLQLSLARSTENPVRTLLTDYAAVEGWALYAEQLFWEGGVACTRAHEQRCGFGDTPVAHRNMLGSYRGRIRRIFYDVNVEMERWTLQEAAEWRAGKPGVEVDRDVLRAINWPTQLIGYFAGKKQILDLRQEARQREGYTEQAFHDALLAEGQIPIALIRAKMLDLPVPRLP